MNVDYVHHHRSLFLNLPDQSYLSQESAFQIQNSEVDRSVQNQIISYFKSQEYQIEKNDPRNSSYGFWDPLSLRTLEQSSVPAPYSDQKISQVEYLFRHHRETKWFWRDHPLSEAVQKIVEPYLGLFDFFTRVKIHFQQPRMRLAFHRDLTAGQRYEIAHPLSTEIQKGNRLVYQMYPWVNLDDLPKYDSSSDLQNCFSLKIPLSEDSRNYGRQTILDQKPYYYTTNGNAYFLNETNYHGSEAVPFLRGLIFVDGILKLQELNQITRDSVGCRPYDYPELRKKRTG